MASVGTVVSTVRVCVDGLETLPAASSTNSLYAPPVDGARIEVASPAALVMVAPAMKVVVPAGANQTVLPAPPELTIATAAEPALVASAAKTTFWLVGTTVSNTKFAVRVVLLPAASMARRLMV